MKNTLLTFFEREKNSVTEALGQLHNDIIDSREKLIQLMNKKQMDPYEEQAGFSPYTEEFEQDSKSEQEKNDLQKHIMDLEQQLEQNKIRLDEIKLHIKEVKKINTFIEEAEEQNLNNKKTDKKLLLKNHNDEMNSLFRRVELLFNSCSSKAENKINFISQLLDVDSSRSRVELSQILGIRDDFFKEFEILKSEFSPKFRNSYELYVILKEYQQYCISKYPDLEINWDIKGKAVFSDEILNISLIKGMNSILEFVHNEHEINSTEIIGDISKNMIKLEIGFQIREEENKDLYTVYNKLEYFIIQIKEIFYGEIDINIDDNIIVSVEVPNSRE